MRTLGVVGLVKNMHIRINVKVDNSKRHSQTHSRSMGEDKRRLLHSTYYNALCLKAVDTCVECNHDFTLLTQPDIY